MSDQSARRLWATLETIQDVVYFASGVRDAGVGLGLRGFWMTYFAFRAAPLGAVGAEPVISCFAGFEWRICFRWREGHAFDVEIVDYH